MVADTQDESKCLTCIYCISRIISPLDYGNFAPVGEIPEDLEDGEYVFAHKMCALTREDLEFTVLECNKYCPINNIRPNIFLSGGFK